MKVILETDRLLLREFVEDDAESFFKLNTDPEVMRFVPDKPLLNVEQARQTLIDHPIADYRRYGFGRGACILKSTGEQIGFAGLKYLDELGEVDVAYRLLPAHWGQGLATEVAHGLPADHRIAAHQPVNDTVSRRHHHSLLCAHTQLLW